MEELLRARDAFEEKRLTVKGRVDEMEAAIGEKRKAMKFVNENIQNKNDKIADKQVTIH